MSDLRTSAAARSKRSIGDAIMSPVMFTAAGPLLLVLSLYSFLTELGSTLGSRPGVPTGAAGMCV